MYLKVLYFIKNEVLSKSRTIKGANTTKPNNTCVFHLVPIGRKIMTSPTIVIEGHMQNAKNVVN